MVTGFVGRVVVETRAIEQSWTYPFASAVTTSRGRPLLELASSHAPVASGHPGVQECSSPVDERLFFAGRLLQPELAAGLLLATSEVALRRYYVPPAMVARILRAADPVMTAAGGRLRLESFSQCCGVYARADLLPDIITVDAFGKGTTNVDFNPSMRAALAQIRAREAMDLRVTSDAVAVTSARGTAIEHKVTLPLRWLKGFAEVQALCSGLEHACTLQGPEARRFLSSLPTQVKAKESAWLIPTAGGLRISQQAASGAVVTAGLGRLTAMKSLARHAEALRIYGSPHGTSGFELDFGAARFMLVLSPAAARGFSGEGQLLATLGQPDADRALARVRAALSWQSDLTATDLAHSLDLPVATVTAAFTLLAAEGLVGFDPRERCYFHRVLPFDLSRIESRQPRLVAARELLAAGGVSGIAADGARITANVRSEEITHRVRFEGDSDTFHCTCIWHARTGGEAGPCKHVLATLLAIMRKDPAP